MRRRVGDLRGMECGAELSAMEEASVCDPCGNGEGLGCVLRVASDWEFEAENERIHDAWMRACSFWRAEREIGQWKERLMDTVTQLQAALRELDDTLMMALVGAGKGGEEKRSYSKTMISCVNSLERELQKGLVVDCGNGTCTLTNEMLKDFSDFSCSVMTGNVWIGRGCEHSPLRSLYCW